MDPASALKKKKKKKSRLYMIKVHISYQFSAQNIGTQLSPTKTVYDTYKERGGVQGVLPVI